MKKLYLITKNFPYNGAESSFIAPELPYLKETFDLVILPTELPEEKEDGHGAGAVVRLSYFQGLLDKLKGAAVFFANADFYRELIEIMKSRHNILPQIYRCAMFGAAAECFYRALKKAVKLDENTQAIFYFYWADYKCFGLTMHKKKYPNIHIVARTHGYELYDERELYGRQFFKKQIDRELDRLVFASEYGKQYYLSKYHKEDGKKYPLHRLGIKNHAWKAPEPGNDGAFILVSCSAVIDIKRIDLIIDGLAQVKESVKWIHFGDGALMDNMRQRAREALSRKSNIVYEWKGALPNKEVMEFYRQHPVNCFITTTATEGGNPVSVQEALSCGIPVIGTAVSDIPFMVENNGVLLSQNPTAEEVGKAISQMCQMDREIYFQWRVNAYQKYLDAYDADKLHPEMVKDLLQLI